MPKVVISLSLILIHSQFWDIFEEVKAVFGWPKFKNFFERDNRVNYTYLRTKIGCEMQFLTRGYAKRRNGFLLGLRYANVSLAHSGVESS